MKEKLPITPKDRETTTGIDLLNEQGKAYTLAFAAGYAAAMDAVKSMLKEAQAG